MKNNLMYQYKCIANKYKELLSETIINSDDIQKNLEDRIKNERIHKVHWQSEYEKLFKENQQLRRLLSEEMKKNKSVFKQEFIREIKI